MNMITVMCSLFTIAFIFSQSLQAGEKSSQISFKTLKVVLSIVKPFKMKRMKQTASDDADYTKTVRETFHPFHEKLRKMAHMAEFGVLAIFIYSTTLNLSEIPLFYRMTSTLFFVLLTAVMDEFIQLFVPGRCSKVSDVLIDFSGGLLGLIFIMVIEFFALQLGIFNY